MAGRAPPTEDGRGQVLRPFLHMGCFEFWTRRRQSLVSHEPGAGAAAAGDAAVPPSSPTAYARGRGKRFSRSAQLMESFLDSDEDEGDVYDEASTSYCDEDGFDVPMSDADFYDNGANMLINSDTALINKISLGP